MRRILDFFKNSKYRVFLLIYSLAFVVVISVALSVLWTYLSKYEQYNPKVTIESFISESTPEYWYELLYNRYFGKTTAFENVNEVIEKLELNEVKAEDLTYYKSVKEYIDESPTYNIYYRNKELAVVKLKPVEEVFLGLCDWKVDNVDLSVKDEQANSVSVGITVPPETVVKVNGVSLSSSHITSSRVEYNNISEFEQGVEGVPYRVKYTVSGLFDMPEIKAYDKDNNELPVDIAQYEFFVGSESTLSQSVDIVAPKGYSVYLNNVKVSDTYIKNQEYGYELLGDVKGYSGSIPVMYSYSVKDLYLEPQIKVLDTEGKEVALKDKKDGTYVYDLQCDADAEKQHESLVIDFVKSYFNYTGNGWKNIAQNHEALLYYVLPGSSADTYIRGSYWGVYYNSTYNIKHNLLDASNFIVYDDSTFSCDLKYNTDFNLYNYNKHFEGSFKFVFVKQGEEFKLSKMVIN